MGDDKIVAEMFVLPVGTLFAFTAVRANFPGAPEGFGALQLHSFVGPFQLISFFFFLKRCRHRSVAFNPVLDHP
jgi:hypothetical protein